VLWRWCSADLVDDDALLEKEQEKPVIKKGSFCLPSACFV
jgi:hypothetical protein